MANALYKIAKQGMLDGTLDLDGSTLKVVLIDSSGYVLNTGDDALSSILAADRVATSGALTGVTCTDGVFNADDVTIAGVTGNQIGAFAVYKDTGVEANDTLIAYFDTDASSAAISLTPNGSDIQITWDALGIFTL